MLVQCVLHRLCLSVCHIPEAAFTLTPVPVYVPVRGICTGEACTSGAFTVTHTGTNTSDLVAVKNFGENC